MERLPVELVGLSLVPLSYRERQVCRRVSRTWLHAVGQVEQLRLAYPEYDPSSAAPAPPSALGGNLHEGGEEVEKAPTKVLEAVREGDLTLVKQWLATKPTHFGTYHQWSSLFYGFDEEEEVADEYWHVLAYACKHSRNPSVVQAIIDYEPHMLETRVPGGTAGHYPHLSGGWRALHIAACFNTPAVVNVLIKAGSKIDQGVYACNMRGMTPIHIAARMWKKNPTHAKANIESLIAAGADISIGVVDGGKTALHSAVEVAAPVSIVTLLLASFKAMCCDYKGGPFYCFSGSLPIHLAMKNPDIPLEVVELLISTAPDTANRVTKAYNTPYRPTPLHLACVFIPHRRDLIKWLATNHLIDVNAILKGEGEGKEPFVVGDTPLHILARQAQVDEDLVRVFMARGANLDITNVKGQTVRSLLLALGFTKTK